MKGKQGRRNNQCAPKNRMFDKFKTMSPEEREAFLSKSEG